VDVAAAVCVLIVEMKSELTSTVAETTRPPPASLRTRMSWTVLHNGIHRPTVTMSTPAQLSVTVSLSGTVTNSDEAEKDSVSVWVAVGVGIAALVIVLAVAILVSTKLFLLCFRILSCVLQDDPSCDDPSCGSYDKNHLENTAESGN